ncbi:DUF2784 domain-containing protein [Massilia horti]|uniref:DUF2784 domain-containing protein n=1 Tax=Massilia horti TaxID=2562153 RepID=A0A4Y9T5W3_9BURK|nr:DUF2784 domain-containing protein [Massilia horti]TFW32658.1 DUF2784 domain-containing protein [Massilia horti]
MWYRAAADLVLVVHLAYILFVVFGGFAVARWRWLVWLHLPAAAWGFAIEIGDLRCPLTYLENLLRVRAGQTGYTGGFLEHYLLWVIYPIGLTRWFQLFLGTAVVLINIAVYTWIWRHPRGRPAQAQ